MLDWRAPCHGLRSTVSMGGVRITSQVCPQLVPLSGPHSPCMQTANNPPVTVSIRYTAAPWLNSLRPARESYVKLDARYVQVPDPYTLPPPAPEDTGADMHNRPSSSGEMLGPFFEVNTEALAGCTLRDCASAQDDVARQEPGTWHTPFMYIFGLPVRCRRTLMTVVGISACAGCPAAGEASIEHCAQMPP